ncbi:hypothetical protein Y032_0685g1522 [Ancylostoma ceylanicum]|uniref:Uncharacterized protein n=1 Tax=Ancylostoma ceylanicum TaxID=53326 RepID=A0A016WH33_9BILA|nr:hypothetical protein Y032_0685g1522 [Ancylostoma ceylanicum]
MAVGITFSTTHRNFSKTRVWYDMNTIFVFSISNNPCMRNLRKFCEISFLPWPSKKRKNLLMAKSDRPKVAGRGHAGTRPLEVTFDAYFTVTSRSRLNYYHL